VKPEGVEEPVQDHEEKQQQQDGQEISRNDAVIADVLQSPGAGNHGLQFTEAIVTPGPPNLVPPSCQRQELVSHSVRACE